MVFCLRGVSVAFDFTLRLLGIRFISSTIADAGVGPVNDTVMLLQIDISIRCSRIFEGLTSKCQHSNQLSSSSVSYASAFPFLTTPVTNINGVNFDRHHLGFFNYSVPSFSHSFRAQVKRLSGDVFLLFSWHLFLALYIRKENIWFKILLLFQIGFLIGQFDFSFFWKYTKLMNW